MPKIQLTDKERCFHETFLNEGGIYIPEINTAQIVAAGLILGESLIEAHTSKLRTPVKINFNIINDTLISAKTRLIGQDYFIGINIGALLAMKWLFNLMLAHPEILKYFGDVSKEVAPEKLFEVRAGDLRIIMDIVEPQGQIFPKTKTRRDLAELLYSFFFQITILHELGHIVNGHLDYKAKNFNKSTIDEALTKIREEDKAIILQGFELDADLFATNHLLNFIKITKENPQLQAVIIKPFFTKLQDAIFLMSFALTCAFKMFGNFKWDIKDLELISHPPAETRMLITHLFTKNFIETNLNHLGYDDISEIIKYSILEAENAFNKISEQPINPNNSLKSCIKHFTAVFAKFKEISSSLIVKK